MVVICLFVLLCAKDKMLQHNLTLFRIDTTNDGIVYTSSSDGTISCTDLDTGIGSPLLNLNPNGWSVSLLSSHVL